MSQLLAYEIESVAGHSVISLNPALEGSTWGDIERAGNELRQHVAAARQPSFLVDLSRLKFMGSSMVALVVKLWKMIQERQGRMVVVNSSQIIANVLSVSGLSQVWTIVDTRDEALRVLEPPAFSNPPSAVALSLLGVLSAAVAAGLLFLRQRNSLGGMDVENARMLAVLCAGTGAILSGFAILKSDSILKAAGVFAAFVSAVLLGVSALG